MTAPLSAVPLPRKNSDKEINKKCRKKENKTKQKRMHGLEPCTSHCVVRQLAHLLPVLMVGSNYTLSHNTGKTQQVGTRQGDRKGLLCANGLPEINFLFEESWRVTHI